MSTHDILAYAVASRVVGQIRAGTPPWNERFSPETDITTSRVWPMPDAVFRDKGNNIRMAMEFKPPAQTKREYLTGLGQSLSYTRDFHYSTLVIPDISDDGYPIGDHIVSTLASLETEKLPLCVIQYDARTLSAYEPMFDIVLWLTDRIGNPPGNRDVKSAFYAKWREITPLETSRYLTLLFEESAKPGNHSGPKHQAFRRFWEELQAGMYLSGGGEVRNANNSKSNYVSWQKNVFNFLRHIFWIEPTGYLTNAGFSALRIATTYGGGSQVFIDTLARAVLGDGKHLVLLTAINDFQNRRLLERGSFLSSREWKLEVEEDIERRGYISRNPERHQAATQGEKRDYFKSENQLWFNLGFIRRYGKECYFPGRGYMFDWERITSLVKTSV